LAAITNDGNGFAGNQVEVGIVIVKNLHERSLRKNFFELRKNMATIAQLCSKG
jgi:hypothetical protein